MNETEAPRFVPILAIDFDGVVHSYSHGWSKGAIYDVPTPGFWEWAREAKKQFKLVIYSSRSKEAAGIKAMQEWFSVHWHLWLDTFPPGIHPGIAPHDFEFAHEKPPAWLTIDDRAICFRGDWSAPELQPDAMKAFKPWMQTEPAVKTDWTAAAAVLVSQLEHGDEAHRQWLRDKAIPLLANALASAEAGIPL